METVAASVSHIVSADPNLSIAGYAMAKEFGDIRICRCTADAPVIRQWQDYNPVIVGCVEQIMRRIDP